MTDHQPPTSRDGAATSSANSTPAGVRRTLDFVDDEPAGGDGALDFELTTDHGIDAMTGAMSGAVDAADGA